MKFAVILLAVILFAIPVGAQQQGHAVLLAVRETDNGYIGSTVDLYLEIQPGKGRVFLETFPLTKVDTQIATRSAKEIACSVLDYDCSSYDFIYTIKSQTGIIAGPSAGAATALLTAAMLKGIPLNDDVALTGTINSYGLIGPVGGLKEKIEAAARKGIKKVLISERYVKEGNSTKTIDLVDYGRALGVEVIEVSDINEAMYYASGQYISPNNISISIDTSYLDTMKFLADDLCARTKKLKNDTVHIDEDVEKETADSASKGMSAYEKKDYYSAASFCFGANVRYLFALFMEQPMSENEFRQKVAYISENILKLGKEVDGREIRTITDLESYMAVKERLQEAADYLNKSMGETNETRLYNLAYANERLYSAYSWVKFFDHRGKEFNIKPTTLRDSCQRVLLEVEERSQYLQVFFPDQRLGAEDELSAAYRDLDNGDYAVCLHKALKAKAEVDIPLNTLGITESQFGEYASRKLESAKSSIARESSKGIFPVLAYSYYEYATNLAESDKFSVLLYSEYAIELSNLDIYFQERKEAPSFNLQNKYAIAVVVFIAGIALGYIIAVIKNPSRRKSLLGKKR